MSIIIFFFFIFICKTMAFRENRTRNAKYASTVSGCLVSIQIRMKLIIIMRRINAHSKHYIFQLIIISHFPLLKAFFEKEIKVLLIFIPQRGNRQKYLQLLYELLLFPTSFVFYSIFD